MARSTNPTIIKKSKLSLFIFRRDLRLDDNTALIAALKNSQQVLVCFIFDPLQINRHEYFSNPGFQFLLNSLTELHESIAKRGGNLYLFYEKPEKIISELIKHHPIEAIFINRDYTPFSRSRDDKIAEISAKKAIEFYEFDDAMLQPPESILKGDGEPYVIFTPYYKNAKNLPVRLPKTNPQNNFYNTPITMSLEKIDSQWYPNLQNLRLQGGRNEGLSLLENIENLKNYSENRNYPALDATSHLSAHIKFGTISMREAYYAICAQFEPECTLITELYWHDFFTQIAWHFPHVFEGAFRKHYNKLAWNYQKSDFEKWCSGQTGFPIVDAGMRELNATGYMHNRVRMITASFLVKDLFIDWRWGEQYFAKKLLDYDPAVNNGNWQWAASTGCDAQPYFRIFNPWLQQQRFDPECEYIKKWLPELAELSAKDIHSLAKSSLFRPKNYPATIIDHKHATEKTKAAFKSCQ